MKQLLRSSPAGRVAAIVVLAVISVFVYERFPDKDAEQRSFAIDGLAGSLRSGAALAHSVWLDDGANLNKIVLGDAKLIDIDPLTGYPSATASGIHELIPGNSNFVGMNQGAAYVFSVTGSSVGTCHVTYVTGMLAGEPPTVTVRNHKNGGDCS